VIGRAGGEKGFYGFVERNHLGNIGIEGTLILKYTLETLMEEHGLD
jgi:hypothetical protein